MSEERDIVERLAELPISLKAIDAAAAEITRLRAEVERLTKEMRNLIAVIDRDGGQTGSTPEQAQSKVVRLFREIDRLTLRWTDEPPTQPGLYLWRHPRIDAKTTVAEVERSDIQSHFRLWTQGGQWSDKPIPELTDTPST